MLARRGGFFLALAYFGTDQSQVQRYLTGRSIAQSRLSLIFMALTKIPMQALILFIGAMVFVVFTFVPPPLLFNPSAMAQLRTNPQFASLDRRYRDAFDNRRSAAAALAARSRSADPASRRQALESYRTAEAGFESVRRDAQKAAGDMNGATNFQDTNYIFLSFVVGYLPRGLVGLVIGVIFSAGMSAIAGEINSLATVSVIDIYRRYWVRSATDRHYLLASRCATVFWGLYAIAFASRGMNFGALIETVNMVGSLFYGCMVSVRPSTGLVAMAGQTTGSAQPTPQA